jgi:A/G-specific adenine glycosylase
MRVPPVDVGSALVRWFERDHRPLPWRKDRDPYHVWVAEVMLQQTRVAQAIPYYARFIHAFPSVRALAAAPLERVLKVWEGAGYYARARHLHAAARILLQSRSGQLPRTVGELEQLPGVGPYIARSVAALAFGVRAVALEANGLRVSARWVREEGDVRAPRVRRELEAVLALAMDSVAPGVFNEALMELGETVCLPVNPRCAECPVRFACRASNELPDPSVLPRRRPSNRRPHVCAAVVALEDGRGRWLVQRRAPTGLLGGLWEFPGGAIETGESPLEAAVRELREETAGRARSLEPVGVVRHSYSHFTVDLHVFRGRAVSPKPREGLGRRWVTPSQLRRLAIPKATEKAMKLLRGPELGRASRDSGSRPGRTSV